MKKMKDEKLELVIVFYKDLYKNMSEVTICRFDLITSVLSQTLISIFKVRCRSCK